MKSYRIPFLTCLTFLCTTMLCFGQIRETTDLNSSWKFFLNPALPAYSPDFNDNGWMTVDLPHTWNAADGYNNNYIQGTGWYRKKVFIPSTFSGKRIYLKFEHANLITQIYVNGIDKGSHEGGYAAFIFDITSSLTFGSNNTIAVKVDNTVNGKIAPLSGDFTFFGGITGKVQLIVTNNINICPIDYASSGIYITQKSVTSSGAAIAVKVLLDNYTGQAKSVAAELNVIRPDQISVASIQKTVLVPASSVKIPVLFEFTIPGPILWDARNNPYLYSVNVSIKESNTILDQVSQPMGIRYFEIRKDSGFYLNGKSYPLYGVNMHEDRPGKGRAISDNERSEDLNMMKDLGVSFLRLSHYQHGSFTYDYADKNGIILWTEIPLIDHINTTYPEYFKSNIKEQLKELIRQNFNHPSVCFWGLFNEILNQPGPNPVTLITELNALAHAEDPGRPTVAANNQPDYPVNVSNITDLISHNRYFGWYYGKANDLQPWMEQVKPGLNGIPVGLSEYGGGASIIHHELYPRMPGVLTPSWHPEELQNEIHEDYWNIIRNNPFLWQTTAWVAFDFISYKKNEGDKPGINDKGLISHDRKTKKDAYYFYKSQWTKEPLVYITSRRFLQRRTGTTYIKVYSNCDSVELLVNNRTLGYRKPVESIFTWDNFVLSEGVNFLKARSLCGGQYAADSCIWIYGGLSQEPGIKINFQTSGTDTPKGYIADTGHKFPYTANNLTFGWNADNSGNSRDRNLFDNKIYDTFNHLQKNGVNYVWEIKLSNGLYYVEVVAGDPLFYDSHHKILVENRLLLDGVPDPSKVWIYAGDTLTVKDGRLTISAAPDALNSKINFLQITRVDSINLSSNKTVKQSSTLYSSIAERAIDNNTDGLWINGSVTHTGSDANAWWEIDLGKISKISTVEIWNRTDVCCSSRLSDFYIIVSNDPFNSQVLNATLLQPNIWSYHQMSSPEPNKVFPVNRSGRYIRIQLNKTDNLHLAEVIVNGYALLPPESPTNLTSNVTDDHSIQLFWTDNSTDESGFIVERRSDSWYYSVIDTLNPNTLQFEDTDINDGEGYSYRLKAFNQSGESNYSNEVSDSLDTYDIINLATGKTATQSSTLYNSHAALAIDENTNGVWINQSVTHTGEESNPWWQIDLGTISNINSITVWNRTDCCKARLKDFYILLSESPFESNDLNQLINNPGIWVEFHPGYPDPSVTLAINKKGRYVRIQLAGNGPLSLAEVIINGTPEGEPESENIAIGKHVEQSNLAYGGIPERAIDNNTDGSWISGSVTHTQINRNSWWQADLGKSYNLNFIEIWNRTDICCKNRLSNYYIFVSDEPFESFDLNQTLNQSGILSIFQSEYPDPSFTADINRTGRYIRIQLLNSGELSLAEVRIFGVPDTELSENLALQATVNQISTTYGSIAEKAIDGNIDGIWINGSVTHTNNEPNAWWEADLGELCNIESVEIFNRTDCCMNRLSDFYLLVSEVPFISHDLYVTMNQSGVWKHFQSQYPNPSQVVEVNKSGRYLRIQLANANNLSIAEIIILGNRFPELRNTFMQGGLSNDVAPDEAVIYPIPVQNVLRINVSGKISEIEIFNLYGVLMQSETGAQSCNEISVGDLLPGIYLIRLRFADGSHEVFRFIKG
jgi:beta-galactosidase